MVVGVEEALAGVVEAEALVDLVAVAVVAAEPAEDGKVAISQRE